MNDYTPTTDDVRRYYANWCDEKCIDEEDGRAEFDRWLAAYTKEVLEKAAERLLRWWNADEDMPPFSDGRAQSVAAVRGDGEQA